MNDPHQTPRRKLTKQEFEQLLELTLANQRAEGFALTEAEIARVRADLLQHHVEITDGDGG